MRQNERLLELVIKKPGLTATQYTRLMGFPAVKVPTIINNCNIHYKPSTILRELQRFVLKGILQRHNGPGVRSSVNAWHFAPKDSHK